tara:strand:- start:252 stop:728 length:477 start_codon:yes stop_codon:yes gene_type:complete
MEAKIETPKRVETIKEEIEKALTTNPKYNFHGTKWFEKTHNQFYWNTDSNNDWLTEEGFKTAHYRRKLLEQEKRKVQELQGIADTEAKHLAENVLEELVYESMEGYDSMIFFEDDNLTLKQWNAENRVALAKKVLKAQTKARFRKWDYQILKSLKVTG